MIKGEKAIRYKIINKMSVSFFLRINKRRTYAHVTATVIKKKKQL